MQSGRQHSPGIHQIQTRPSDCQIECESSEYVSTPQRALYYSIRRMCLGMLACSSPAMETYAMKLQHRFCADVNARGSLKLQLLSQQSTGDIYALCTSEPCEPALSLYTLKLLWFLNASAFHSQFITEYIGGKKFCELNCCNNDISLQLFRTTHSFTNIC
ncbi:hypothetical protein AOLI_G00305230 [Acnodon oligacanthus]